MTKEELKAEIENLEGIKLAQETALNKEYNIVEQLQKENSELKERLSKVETEYKRKPESEWNLNDLYQRALQDFATAEKCSREYFTRYRTMVDRCVKAKDIIKDLLDDLTAIDGEETKELEVVKRAEQFLKEIRR